MARKGKINKGITKPAEIFEAPLRYIQPITKEEAEKLPKRILMEGSANPQIASLDTSAQKLDRIVLTNEADMGRLAKQIMLPKHKKKRAKWEKVFQDLLGMTIEQAAEQQKERERLQFSQFSSEKN
ncbi:hypothetical protein TWF694_001258 [Orbilia ellipsospora]|uniref:Ribosome biogenesis protein NOP53 n=1 Tax=Orbilia ellipsospora TaxID=2528407 RepID=A0AAV9XR28_9PEZI